MESEPRLSVVMPTRNRAGSLDLTLESICRLEKPSVSWELVIADNGSSDATPDVIDAYRDRLPIVPVEEPKPGMNRARNRAIEAAGGELLVFTDDDVEVMPNWLTEVYEGAQRWSGDTVFGGRIVPEFPPHTPEWMTADDFFFKGYAFSAYAPAVQEGPVTMTPFGPNFAVRRRLLAERLFDPRMGPNGSSFPMGAETEFLLWARSRGCRFIYLPRAEVSHRLGPRQVSESHLLQRAINAGRGWEALNLDVEIGSRERPLSWASLYAMLWKYRLRRFTRPFASEPRRFRDRVKLHVLMGRCKERAAAQSALVRHPDEIVCVCQKRNA